VLHQVGVLFDLQVTLRSVHVAVLKLNIKKGSSETLLLCQPYVINFYPMLVDIATIKFFWLYLVVNVEFSGPEDRKIKAINNRNTYTFTYSKRLYVVILGVDYGVLCFRVISESFPFMNKRIRN
jgi:hypothetical protein